MFICRHLFEGIMLQRFDEILPSYSETMFKIGINDPGLQHLTLRGKISLENLKQLDTVLEKNTYVTSLQLEFDSYTEKSINDFSKVLQRYTAIEIILPKITIIAGKLSVFFPKLLAQLPRLKQLGIIDTSDDPAKTYTNDAISSILNVLETTTTNITVFKLERAQDFFEASEPIGKLLLKLEEVSLKILSEKTQQSIAKPLAESNTLKTLKLQMRCPISLELIEAIKNNKNLRALEVKVTYVPGQSINLHSNQIEKYPNVGKLLTVIASSQIRNLRLSIENVELFIQQGEDAQIKKAFANNHTLEEIYIDSYSAELLSLVSPCTSLKKVYYNIKYPKLSFVGAGPSNTAKEIEAVCELLKGRIITELTFNTNHHSEGHESADKLIKEINSTPTLTKITFNSIFNSEQIAKLIASNKYLQEMSIQLTEHYSELGKLEVFHSIKDSLQNNKVLISGDIVNFYDSSPYNEHIKMLLGKNQQLKSIMDQAKDNVEKARKKNYDDYEEAVNLFAQSLQLAQQAQESGHLHAENLIQNIHGDLSKLHSNHGNLSEAYQYFCLAQIYDDPEINFAFAHLFYMQPKNKIFENDDIKRQFCLSLLNNSEITEANSELIVKILRSYKNNTQFANIKTMTGRDKIISTPDFINVITVFIKGLQKQMQILDDKDPYKQQLKTEFKLFYTMLKKLSGNTLYEVWVMALNMPAIRAQLFKTYDTLNIAFLSDMIQSPNNYPLPDISKKDSKDITSQDFISINSIPDELLSKKRFSQHFPTLLQQIKTRIEETKKLDEVYSHIITAKQLIEQTSAPLYSKTQLISILTSALEIIDPDQKQTEKFLSTMQTTAMELVTNPPERKNGNTAQTISIGNDNGPQKRKAGKEEEDDNDHDSKQCERSKHSKFGS